MRYIAIVALLAVAQYYFFGVQVSRARHRYGVHAPATSGHVMFERALRVQVNTLEQLVVFLPVLFIAGHYWPPAWAAGIGLVYLGGRVLFWRRYMQAPETRAIGFLLTVIPIFALMALGLAGALLD